MVADSKSAAGLRQGTRSPFVLVLVVTGVVLGFGLLASLTGGSSSNEPVVNDPDVEILVAPDTLPGTTVPAGPVAPTAPLEPQRPILGIPDPGNPSVAPITGWIPGDGAADPLPLGEGGPLLGSLYLDFLSEFCEENRCFRDAVMRNLDDSEEASEPLDDYAFVIRHGFPNSDEEPLGDGYAVDVYIRKESGPTSEGGAFEVGTTYKFTSDYVVRGTADICGPTYKSQSSPVECEWFVHEFPDGLPRGRYDLWTVWSAPCSAWLAMGLADSCIMDAEVLSLFSAAVNSPFRIEGN